MGSDSDSDGHPIDGYLARALKRPRVQAAAGQSGVPSGDPNGDLATEHEVEIPVVKLGGSDDEDESEGNDGADSHGGSITSGDEAAADEVSDGGEETAAADAPAANAASPLDPAAGEQTATETSPATGVGRAEAAAVAGSGPGGTGADATAAQQAEPDARRSSGGGGAAAAAAGQPKPAHKAPPEVKTKPLGVVLVEDTSEIVRDFDVAKLLRNPRYFDDYAEVQTSRCFNCGQVGHAARDCTNQARVKPCYLCAQFGHDGRDCPSQLCFRCGRAGHKLRECREQPGAMSADRPCLRCGQLDCDAAGKGDYFRYEGGCTRAYAPADLRHVRCMSCGDLGHLMCKPVPKVPSMLSCYNCGRLGHYGECCPAGTRPHLLAERRGDEERATAQLLEYEMEMDREYEEKRRREQQQQRGYGGVGGGYDRYRDGGGGGGGYGHDQRRSGGPGGGYGGAGDGGYGGGGGGGYGGGYGGGGGARNAQIEWGYEPPMDGRRGGGGVGGGGRMYSPEPYARGGGGGQRYDDRRVKTPRW